MPSIVARVSGARMIAVGSLILLSAAATIAALRWWNWDLRQTRALTITLLALDFVVRPFEQLVRLDTPFPDTHFAARTVEDAMVRAQVAYLLFLAAFVVTGWCARRIPTGLSNLERRLPPSDVVLRQFLPILVLLAIGSSLWAWQEYGVTGLARVAKGQEVDLPRMLRNPAVLLAYLGMATAVLGIHDRKTKTVALGIVAFVAGSAVSFTWGARGAALLPFVIPTVALLVGVRERHRRSVAEQMRVVAVSGLILLVVLGAGFGLRVARENISLGGTNARTTEGSLFRRLAVTTNHTAYDAALLVFDDEDPSPISPGLGIFVDASRNALSPFVPSSGPVERPAITVARTFEPNRANGWPITALGDWFLAGGFLGVALGGAASGAISQWIDRWQETWRPRHWMLVTTLSVIWATSIASSGGVGVTTPARLRTQLPIYVVLIATAFVWSALIRRFRPLANGSSAVT